MDGFRFFLKIFFWYYELKIINENFCKYALASLVNLIISKWINFVVQH